MSRSGFSARRRAEEGIRPSMPDEELQRRHNELRRRLVTDAILPDDLIRRVRPLGLPPIRVAVIGGGFSGIYAAWYLHQCGAAVTVYEARDLTGGRVRSDPNFIPRRNVEVGAELIGFNHPLWFELASRLGLTLTPLTEDDEYELPPASGARRSTSG